MLSYLKIIIFVIFQDEDDSDNSDEDSDGSDEETPKKVACNLVHCCLSGLQELHVIIHLVIIFYFVEG